MKETISDDRVLSSDYLLFLECIDDIYKTPIVQSMDKYIHHGNTSCLEHCKIVAYKSFKVSRTLKLDYRSTARGAFLHDFYLYDWHIKGSHVGLHGFRHSKISLENAKKHFILNSIEEDIITKHMWPLTIKLPRYRESFIVLIVDKYSSILEILIYRYHKIKHRFKK